MKYGGAGELNLMLDGCVCPEPLEVGISFTVEGVLHHKGNSGEEKSFWQKCRKISPSFSSSSKSPAAELVCGLLFTGLASSC